MLRCGWVGVVKMRERGKRGCINRCERMSQVYNNTIGARGVTSREGTLTVCTVVMMMTFTS